MQLILKVYKLLFSEDLGKNINSSTCIHIHMASRNFRLCLVLCRIGNTETVLFSALNNVVRLIVVTGNEPLLLVSAISKVLLAMSGNCAVSSLRNREVSAIEGALIHTGIGSCIWDFIVCYKEAVCHSGVSIKRGSTVYI